jgi:hypothetical protein
MIVREKRSGEEWSFPLELELVPPFPLPGPEWEFGENEGKQSFARNTQTGELRYPAPNSLWCIHLPELLETEAMPTRNLARRHTGNWNHVAPGQDEDYEFIPETDEEQDTLKLYGFTFTVRPTERQRAMFAEYVASVSPPIDLETDRPITVETLVWQLAQPDKALYSDEAIALRWEMPVEFVRTLREAGKSTV